MDIESLEREKAAQNKALGFRCRQPRFAPLRHKRRLLHPARPGRSTSPAQDTAHWLVVGRGVHAQREAQSALKAGRSKRARWPHSTSLARWRSPMGVQLRRTWTNSKEAHGEIHPESQSQNKLSSRHKTSPSKHSNKVCQPGAVGCLMAAEASVHKKHFSVTVSQKRSSQRARPRSGSIPTGGAAALSRPPPFRRRPATERTEGRDTSES